MSVDRSARELLARLRGGRAGAMSALVALATLLLVELLRTFPALVAASTGARTASWLATGASSGPFVAAALALAIAARHDPRRTLWLGSLSLAVGRALVQLLDGDVAALAAGVGLAGGLVVVGLLAVIGLPLFGGAVLAGAGLAAATRVALGSRDLVWIEHPLAAGASFVLCAWFLHLGRRRTRRDVVVLGRSTRAARTLVVLGPVLLVEAFVLTNLGWVGPAVGHGWLAGSTVIALGAVAGVAGGAAAAARPDLSVDSIGLAGAVALVGLALAFDQPGLWWAPMVVVAQAGAGALLTAVSSRGVRTGRRRAARRGVAVAPLVLLAGITALDGRGLLGRSVDPSSVVGACGALALVGAVAAARLPHHPAHRPGWRHVPSLAVVFALPAALLVAGLPLLVRAGGGAHVGDARELRVVTYNVALGVDDSGRLNLDGVAGALAETRPDVVVLQEVPRGFPPTGVDAVGYVQHALGFEHVAFQPSAPGALHGNAVISRYPIRVVQVREFLRQGTTLPRGAIAATIDVPVGDDVVVIGSHLPPGGSRSERAARLATLVALWGGRDRTIVALDANAVPGSSTVDALVDAGLVLPEGGGPTFPSSGPLARIDLVLHSPDLEVVESRVVRSRASDHLPVLAVVRPTDLV